MKKLKYRSPLEISEIFSGHCPIMTWDLKFGLIIFGNQHTPTVGVQVFGEADCRHVRIENIYTEGGALLEVHDTYSDEAFDEMYRNLTAMDAEQARFVISALEQVGFDIEYEDFRTLQDGYHISFDFNPPPRLAGKLTIKAISHRPTFCARHGHDWDEPQIELLFEDAIISVTCGHCGYRKPLTEEAYSTWVSTGPQRKL